MTIENTQRGEFRAAAIFGLIIAIAIDIGWLFTLFLYMSQIPGDGLSRF